MRRWLLILVWLLCGCASSPPPEAPAQARRIVCLVPSLTEVLFSLGAGPRVVGVTANDNFPPEVASLPRVGDQVPDYERLLALEPDLVVADPGMQPREIDRLRDLRIPVLSLPAQSLEGLEGALSRLGAVTETEARAAELESSLKERLRHFRARSGPRVRVFVEIWNRPLMTSGSGTYVDQLIGLAGGENVYQDFVRTYPQVSIEDLLQRQPDVIVLTVGEVDEARTRPGWNRLKAVQAGRVFKISSDLLVRPTLRFGEAVEQLEKALHPR